MIGVPIEDRLENWGRAWRVGLLSYECAESFEGRYRSPQPWDAPVTTPQGDPDSLDAAAIESAVCALSIFDHLLLKGWYVRRWSTWKTLGVALRGAGLQRAKRMNFDSLMMLAKVHLLAELDRPAVTRKRRAVEHVRRLLGTGLTMQEVCE